MKRLEIIRAAIDEWNGSPELQKLTLVRSYANAALHDADLPAAAPGEFDAAAAFDQAGIANSDRASSAATRAGPVRQKIIDGAAAEYDSAPAGIRQLCSLRDFVNLALREGGLPFISGSDRTAEVAVLHSGKRSEREGAIASLAGEWYRERQLQLIVTKETFVNGSLIERNLPGLTAEEAHRL